MSTINEPICEWCGGPVFPHELSSVYDGGLYHIDCAAEAMDNETFDSDMGASG